MILIVVGFVRCGFISVLCWGMGVMVFRGDDFFYKGVLFIGLRKVFGIGRS